MAKGSTGSDKPPAWQAEVEARKAAWREAELSHDPQKMVQKNSVPPRTDLDHRLSAPRTKIDPRNHLGDIPWHKRSQWPMRAFSLFLLALVIFRVMQHLFSTDQNGAIYWVVMLPLAVSFCVVVFAHKK